MAMALVDDLRDDVQAGRAVIVAGAGVSIASSSGAKDWTSFLRCGVERALEYNKALPEEWKRIVEVELEASKSYSASLPGVASKVVDALGGRNGAELASWLRAEFAELSVETTPLIDAIGQLGLPILTTNFDHLLERRLGRETATWRAPSHMQLVLQGRSKDIGHLHGSWRDAESVILGEQSYGEIIGDSGARAIQEALTSARAVVFVGCGAGVADPNFTALREWMRRIWSGAEARHFRLCLDSDVAPLTQEHDGERIRPVGFGGSHDDLPDFLLSLGSVASRELVSVASAPAISAKEIDQKVVAEAVLGEHLAQDQCSWTDLTIPPVLLPIPHEQFVRSQDLPRDQRARRLDPDDEALRPGITLVTSDDRVGLTTALEWLTLRNYDLDGRAVPVIIDFKNVGAGPQPLKKQIVKELRVSGVPLRDSSEMPTVALALDNFSGRPKKMCDRVLAEIGSGTFSRVVIGTKQGNEAEVLDALNRAGLSVTVRYLGRLNQRDIEALATLVSPSRASELASKVIEIVNREHLPRTPFTLSLLISAILQGEALLSTASETALLDAYVSLLMGRGDPHENARFSLDAHERTDILATLAEVMVERRVGSLPEADVLGILARYFDEVDWVEDPLDVLGNLIQRHLLSARSGHVAFTQASYLHLFAAKRAMSSQKFRLKLLEDPLYLAPIVAHYAALTRDDQEILETVEKLLWGEMQEPTESINFATDAIGTADSVDELVERLNLPEKSPSAKKESADVSAGDWLDQLDDSDTTPFPLDAPEDLPPAVRVMKLLTTVSNVLRDSELVRDSQLKQRVLQRALFLWGRLVVLLENDADYQEYVEDLVSRMAEDIGLSEKRQDSLLSAMREIAPLLTGFGGMSSTLASRKLSRSLGRCFSVEAFQDDAPSVVMGALLALSIQGDGWTSYFLDAGKKHIKVRAVQGALKGIALGAYYRQTLKQEEVHNLEQFLVDVHMADMNVKSSIDEKLGRDRLLGELRNNRLRHAKGRLPAGETAFTSSVEDREVDGGPELDERIA